MLIKTGIFVFLLFFGSAINAQVAFYLRPTILVKTNESQLGGGLHVPGNNMVSNQHFSFLNNPMFFDGNIDIGINLGIQLNKKHFLELGLSQDHSSIGNSMLIHSTYTDFETGVDYKTANSSFSTTSPHYGRLSLDYHYNFWSNKNETLRLQSIVGVGMLLNGNGTNEYGSSLPEPNSPDDYQEIAPDVFITNKFTLSRNYAKNSTYLKFGLGMDFFTKKDRHLFSLDVTYLYSRRTVQYEENRIHVLDHGVETNYLSSQTSRGSGLYFTLSRKFQVYPWIPLSKSKREGDKL